MRFHRLKVLRRLPHPGHGFTQCLQQQWRLELERLGQFLHDIRFALPLELAQFGQHRRVERQAEHDLALGSHGWRNNLNRLLKRQRPVYCPAPGSLQRRL